ncbi:MAG: serine/threonine-protein kinase, partial [Pseudomonadota bacterium]
YLGEHVVLGHTVAIKVMQGDLLDSALTHQAVSRFINEAKALAQLKEVPQIIRLYDFGQLANGHPYYVMEYIEGHNLKNELHQKGALSPQDALPYLKEICLGLQAAHDHQILHRDLKPANIYILKGEPLRLKILDFGLAKQFGTLRHGTAGGMGSPFYAPPELIMADHDLVGKQSDIFSLGVLIYKMLTGRIPYHVPIDPTPYTLFMLPAMEDPIPLQERIPTIPKAMADIVEQCLAKTATDRPESAMLVYQKLERAIHDFPGGNTCYAATVPRIGSKPKIGEYDNASSRVLKAPRSRRVTFLIVSAAILVIAGTSFAIWSVNRTPTAAQKQKIVSMPKSDIVVPAKKPLEPVVQVDARVEKTTLGANKADVTQAKTPHRGVTKLGTRIIRNSTPEKAVDSKKPSGSKGANWIMEPAFEKDDSRNESKSKVD